MLMYKPGTGQTQMSTANHQNVLGISLYKFITMGKGRGIGKGIEIQIPFIKVFLQKVFAVVLIWSLD